MTLLSAGLWPAVGSQTLPEQAGFLVLFLPCGRGQGRSFCGAGGRWRGRGRV